MVSIGPRLKVDGEEEYRQKINSIIQQSKTLDAELKAMAAAFDENASAEEKARITTYNLNEQLDLAKKRTELVREMTQKAAETTEENSSETLKWRQALAAAEEQQAKLERAVQENTKAIEQQDEQVEESKSDLVGLGDVGNSVAGIFGGQLPEALTTSLNEMGSFSAGTVAAMGTAGAAIGAAYNIAKQLFDLTKEAAAQADALLTRSAQTGIDTSTLQGLDYASRFLDFEGVDQTLVKFTQNMAAAEEGAQKQADAFDRLRISVENEDGSLRNNWETFLEAIDALGQVENATERDRLANDLFGKSYSDLKPLIEAGTGAMQGYIDEAQRLGYIIDEQTVKKLGAMDDALQRNEASSEALKTKVAGELAPSFALLTDAATGVQDAASSFLENDTATGIVEWISSLTSPIMGNIFAFKSLADVWFEAKQVMNETAEAAEPAVESYEAQTAAAESMRDALTELSESYNQAYEAALASIEGQFGQWEQAPEVAAKSVQDMIAAQESQANWWEEYGNLMDQLLERDIEGIDKLAEKFADGSQESAEALRGLSTASDEEIEKLISSMDKTEGAKENLAGRFAALETDIDGKLDSIAEEYTNMITDINTESGNLDFGPFETSVDQAFGYLENRAAGTIETVRAWLNELDAEIGQAASYGGSPGYNAAGDTNWRGGLTWVGEQGPELVSLPQGSRIYSNPESERIAAGTDTRAIESLLSGITAKLQRIDDNLSDMETVRRMYGYG